MSAKTLSQFPWFHLTCRTFQIPKWKKDSVSPSAQLSALGESDICETISHDSISHVADFHSHSRADPLPIPLGCTWCSLTLTSVYTHMVSQIWRKGKCFSPAFSHSHCACRILIIWIQKHLVIVAVWKGGRKKKNPGDLHPGNDLVDQSRAVKFKCLRTADVCHPRESSLVD